MNCDQVREYLDTTLPEGRSIEQVEQILRHARDCAACAKYLAETDALERQLHSLAAIPADVALLPAVMSRVQQTVSSPVRADPWAGEVLRWLALAAGVAICVVAYYGRLASGQWFTEMVSLHTQPTGLTSSLLRQPPPFTILCGIGALLAAAAILWQGSEEEGQTAPTS